MKHLIIIGARGYGRGVCDIARLMKNFDNEFDIKGFLDDKMDALDMYVGYPPIIGAVESYEIQEDDVFVCALGDVNYKRKYVELILKKGGNFMNIIHPSVHIGSNLKIGQGCVIAYGSFIDSDVQIGDFVNIQACVVVGHDSKIGDWTILDCHTFIGGFAMIGKSATIHTGAKILPKIIVGDCSTANAGSIVIRNVKKDSVVMGNPAREMIIPKNNNHD